MLLPFINVTICITFAQVKNIFLIIGLYLLGLSGIPCSDSMECNVSAEATISASSNHEEHNHANEANEACTPFCTCACCAITAFHHPLNKVQTVKIFLQSEKYLHHNEGLNTSISCSIWQPPRLVA